MRKPVRRPAATAVTLLALVLALGACTEDTEPTSSPTDDVTSSSPPASSPPETEPSEGEPADDGTAVPLYFATDSPTGARLAREFQRVPGDPLTEAARLVTGNGEPLDPDYRTLWPTMEIEQVEATDGVLLVTLPGDGFTVRPDGMTRREAQLAVQQLVYTLQGVQQERVPVVIRRDEGLNTLFGLSTDTPFRQASALKTLNRVNITTPAEGTTVEQGPLEVSGVANSFEANVVCTITDSGVPDTPFTADGWMGDKLFPFSGTLDLSSVAPGEHTLTCSTDDPSDGEGPGAYTDTKTIVVG